MNTFAKVDAHKFHNALNVASNTWTLIKEYVTLYPETDYENMTCYLSEDSQSGYAIKTDGELVSVFSLIKGRGHAIVNDAISHGAIKLDCFDGYLPKLYQSNGFTEYKREANWNGNKFPDVVYMRRNTTS